MKLGILGVGSVGLRHVRALASLGVRDVTALRTRRGRAPDLPPDLAHVRQLADEDEFWRSELDGVVIANPTTLHANALERAAARGLRVFVEKPIAAELHQLPKAPVATDNVIVGFCMRFHPLVEAIRTFITAPSSPIGRVLKARMYFGSYLPRWYPDPDYDYRVKYVSRKDLGGGVLRTYCHEIDIVQHLFGPIVSVAADVQRLSELEIDVDDSAMLLCRTQSRVVASVEVDFLAPGSSRFGMFMGTKGRLDYDFNPMPAARFVGYDREEVEVFSRPNYPIDDMYRAQMADYLDFIRTGETRACSYAEAVAVMRVIEAAEQHRVTPV